MNIDKKTIKRGRYERSCHGIFRKLVCFYVVLVASDLGIKIVRCDPDRQAVW